MICLEWIYQLYDIHTTLTSTNVEATGKFFGFEATEGWVSKRYTKKDDNCTTEMNQRYRSHLTKIFPSLSLLVGLRKWSWN